MEAAINRLSPGLAKKRRLLGRRLASMGRVLIAFSGGRDSVLLLHEAVSVLGGERVRAVTASSRIYSRSELRSAREVARMLGVTLTTLETHELSLQSFSANGPDRCRICKQHLFGLLREMAEVDSIDHVLDGLNSTEINERDEHLLAPARLGVISPLADAGLTRGDVRKIAEVERLPVSTRKHHCLASRVSTGIPLTGRLLSQIERAEACVQANGFSEAIVRLHSDGLARIKVPSDQVSGMLAPATAAQIAQTVAGLGFNNVAVDLDGM